MKSACLVILGFLMALWFGVGCAHSGTASNAPPSREAAIRTAAPVASTGKSEGYALLYDLVSQEKNVSKLLIIKRETDQLHDVIKRIAEAAKQTTEALEALAKENPPLNLKQTGLPGMERRTRDLIDEDTGKLLLHSKDGPLEFRLLQTQVESMNYGAYLSRALLEVEPNPARRKFLEQTDKKLTALHDEVYQMILNRYVR